MALDDFFNVIQRRPATASARVRIMLGGAVIAGNLATVDAWRAGVSAQLGDMPRAAGLLYLSNARNETTGIELGWFACELSAVLGLAPG